MTTRKALNGKPRRGSLLCKVRGMFAGIFALAALAAGAAVVEPKATDEVLCNPGMGFVHFYYSSRIWAYGAQTEPGDTLDWMPGTTVIYMRLPWCYLEPEEGVYRWDLLDSKTAPWIKAGKKVAFRISCQDHTLLSIPQWVMDAGVKGKWTHEDEKLEFVPYKQEFDAFWDDPVFLAKVEQFLKAFAARYDGNPDVAFVDLGSLGIYGEAHTSKFAKDAKDRPEEFRRIAKIHLDLLRRCLPNTYLVVSDDIGNDGHWSDLKRKDPATGALLDDSPIFKYCRELGIGFRDDSIMCSKNYWWSDRFARRFAKETPVVVETGHMTRRLDNGVWKPEKLKECIEAYRASYFSTHSFPDLYWEVNKDVWKETANRLGYRLELRRVEYPDVVKVNEPVVVKSTWVNVGVAPQYGNATLTWNLLNDKGVVCWRVTDNKFGFRAAEPKWDGVEKPVDVTTPCRFGYTAPVPNKDVVLDWFVKHNRNLPGEKVELLKPGRYTLAVSVGRRDGKPEIALPLEGGIGRIYPVGKVEVK